MKTWLKENWFRFGILAIITLALFGYIQYLYEKNDYIAQKELAERMDKLDAEKKEYVAEQKQNCLDIYQAESKKWGNVTEWRYIESQDVCQIVYKDPNPKNKAECEKKYPTEGLTGTWLIDVIDEKLLCIEGYFSKEF